jgi:hypothetical protein
MSFEAIESVYAHSRTTGSTRLILTYLAHRSNKDRGGLSWPAVATIARHCRLSVRQVQRRLREAAALGELKISEQTGRSQQNEYLLTLPPAGVTSAAPVNSDTPVADDRRRADAGVRGRDDSTVTQTETGTEKENLTELPPTPFGEGGEESDFNFWLNTIPELFSMKADVISARDRRRLIGMNLPPREDAAYLRYFMGKDSPEANDSAAAAQLLRLRKWKPSNLIRSLPEAIANARRYSDLQGWRPAPPPRLQDRLQDHLQDHLQDPTNLEQEPTHFEWRLFVELSLNGHLTSRDRWCTLPLEFRQLIESAWAKTSSYNQLNFIRPEAWPEPAFDWRNLAVRIYAKTAPSPRGNQPLTDAVCREFADENTTIKQKILAMAWKDADASFRGDVYYEHNRQQSAHAAV